MKKTTLLAAAAALLLTATSYAQTEPVPAPAPETQPVADTTPVTTTGDKYNNWTTETYKMQPMPEALTTEKIFPAIGNYELTAPDGTTRTVSVKLDPANKGVVWIEGLEAVAIKANLRKSPAVYKIPAQKLGEEKDAKSVAEGVMIYDKDANLLSICLGCGYNAADPALAFTPDATTETEEADSKATAKNKKNNSKVAKIKPVHYTGAKIMETTAATVPMQ